MSEQPEVIISLADVPPLDAELSSFEPSPSDAHASSDAHIRADGSLELDTAPSLATDSSRSSLSASSSTLDTPSHSSCHTSILRSSSSFTLPSLSRTSVSFAPLPEMDPRRRKSSMQLGVAARSRMLHNRRVLREQARQHGPVPPPMPVWSDIDDGVAEDARAQEYADTAEDVPDPLVSLGKLVRGASRSLWRRVSQKDAQKGDGASSAGTVRTREELPSGPLFVEAAVGEPCAQVGGVWEEEVSAASWQRLISQDAAGETQQQIPTAYKRTSTVVALTKLASVAKVR
ncbi:hypothetical protein B0H21DRAFT_724391 [Amylocystis lapponica]|nr:hypothetical protein B0H21DRAFT_724391 [Amylocystis lapponica]